MFWAEYFDQYGCIAGDNSQTSKAIIIPDLYFIHLQVGGTCDLNGRCSFFTESYQDKMSGGGYG